MDKIKGFKGFNKDLKCLDKQYKVGETFTEEKAELCKTGMHFCENPCDIFVYYTQSKSRFCEVEAEDVSNVITSDSKMVCKKLTVKDEISVFDICKIAVNVFFDNIKFKDKIKKAANAGSYGDANAWDYGAANAGYRGVSISGERGSSSVGEGGISLSYSGKARGGIVSILILFNRDENGHIIDEHMIKVDGVKILPDKWYIYDKGCVVLSNE